VEPRKSADERCPEQYSETHKYYQIGYTKGEDGPAHAPACEERRSCSSTTHHCCRERERGAFHPGQQRKAESGPRDRTFGDNDNERIYRILFFPFALAYSFFQHELEQE
jgi:hypothetical protein